MSRRDVDGAAPAGGVRKAVAAAAALATAAVAALATAAVSAVVGGCSMTTATTPGTSASTSTSASASSSAPSGASKETGASAAASAGGAGAGGRCVALGPLQALGGAVREAAAIGLGGGRIAIAALAPGGMAIVLEEHEEALDGEHEPPAAAAPAVARTRILLGVGARGELPGGLATVADTSLPPRAISVHRHPAGVALAWLEPPGLMLLRAGEDGLPVGEPRLVARNATEYALHWAGSGFVLVAKDGEGVFSAALGPDGAPRSEPERHRGAKLETIAAAVGIGRTAAAGTGTETETEMGKRLPAGAPPGPVAAVEAGPGRVAFVWLDGKTGAIHAALAECP